MFWSIWDIQVKVNHESADQLRWSGEQSKCAVNVYEQISHERLKLHLPAACWMGALRPGFKKATMPTLSAYPKYYPCDPSVAYPCP